MSPHISVELIAHLLMILQILMALDGPQGHHMRPVAIALPITSKPIESTAEKLAWQAWLLLPPEQKSQIKSRKVTPKSIFILPLRGDCPPGHQKVDTKCIPIATGSNSVLIDPNVLSLVVGDTGTSIDFDYGEEEGEVSLSPARPSMPAIIQALNISDYSAPTNVSDDFHMQHNAANHKDEPLKFNIFQNKYPTDYDFNEDYLIVSGEGESISTEDDSIALATADGLNASVLRTNSTPNKKEGELENRKTLTQSLGIGMDDLVWPVLGLEPEDKPRRITMTKDDSATQYSSHVFDQENDASTNETLTLTDISELLRNEALMPILNTTQQQFLKTNTTAASSAAAGRDEITKPNEQLVLNIESDFATYTPVPPNEDDRTDAIETHEDPTDFLATTNIRDRISKLPVKTTEDYEARVDGELTALAKQFQNYFFSKGNDNKSMAATSTPTTTSERIKGNEAEQERVEQQQLEKLKVEQVNKQLSGEGTTTATTESTRKDQADIGTEITTTNMTKTTTNDNQTAALTPLSSDQQTKRIDDRFHYQHLKTDGLLARSATNATITTTIRDRINPLQTTYETSLSPAAVTATPTNSYLTNGIDNTVATDLHSSHINPAANDSFFTNDWDKVIGEAVQQQSATNFTAFVEGNYNEISNSYQTALNNSKWPTTATTNHSRLSIEPTFSSSLSSVLALEGNWSNRKQLYAVESRSKPEFAVLNERTSNKSSTNTNNKSSLAIDSSTLIGHQSPRDDHLARLWWMPVNWHLENNSSTNNNENPFELKTQWQKLNNNNNSNNNTNDNDNKSKSKTESESESEDDDESKSESSLEDSLLYRFWSKYHNKHY